MFIRSVKNFRKITTTAPDKSITHRAVMFNAAADGEATVTNALLGGDCRSTIDCMRRLGASVTVEGSTVYVRGTSVFKDAELDAGNSGTTTRLLTGLLAGKGITASIDGDESLRSRPMRRVTDPLALMGADVRATDGKAPVYIRPARLRGIDYTLPVASAQLKSALLLAGLNADGVTRITEPVLSRDHTELMLKAMGADIKTDGLTVSIKRGALKNIDVRVPGDISSAAFLFAAAAVTGGEVTVCDVGLNPTRTGVIEVLKVMGAGVDIKNYRHEVEPRGDVTVTADALRPFFIGAADVPSLIDELPLLAVVACFAKGDSEVRGATELRVKESDRIKTTAETVRALGGKITELPDGFVIHGEGGLIGGKVHSHGDHRIAMSAAIGGLGSREGCEIEGADSAAVSYPSFWEDIC